MGSEHLLKASSAKQATCLELLSARVSFHDKVQLPTNWPILACTSASSWAPSDTLTACACTCSILMPSSESTQEQTLTPRHGYRLCHKLKQQATSNSPEDTVEIQAQSPKKENWWQQVSVVVTPCYSNNEVGLKMNVNGLVRQPMFSHGLCNWYSQTVGQILT